MSALNGVAVASGCYMSPGPYSASVWWLLMLVINQMCLPERKLLRCGHKCGHGWCLSRGRGYLKELPFFSSWCVWYLAIDHKRGISFNSEVFFIWSLCGHKCGHCVAGLMPLHRLLNCAKGYSTHLLVSWGGVGGSSHQNCYLWVPENFSRKVSFCNVVCLSAWRLASLGHLAGPSQLIRWAWWGLPAGPQHRPTSSSWPTGTPQAHTTGPQDHRPTFQFQPARSRPTVPSSLPNISSAGSPTPQRPDICSNHQGIPKTIWYSLDIKPALHMLNM